MTIDRRLISWAGLALAALGVSLGALPPMKAARAADTAPSHIEKVTVIGVRLSELRRLLSGNTLRGTEGFVDGSAPEEDDNRTSFPWEVYYDPNGTLEAHFRRIGARVPHGTMEELDYQEHGTWSIEDGDLCQSIPRVGSGSTVCFELRRVGANRIRMYYTRCGAMNRCYPGRLGPEGEIFPGRSFSR